MARCCRQPPDLDDFSTTLNEILNATPAGPVVGHEPLPGRLRPVSRPTSFAQPGQPSPSTTAAPHRELARRRAIARLTVATAGRPPTSRASSSLDARHQLRPSHTTYRSLRDAYQLEAAGCSRRPSTPCWSRPAGSPAGEVGRSSAPPRDAAAGRKCRCSPVTVEHDRQMLPATRSGALTALDARHRPHRAELCDRPAEMTSTCGTCRARPDRLS